MKSKGIDQAKGFVESNWSQAMGTGRSRVSPWLALALVVLLAGAGWFGWKTWFAARPQAQGPARWR